MMGYGVIATRASVASQLVDIAIGTLSRRCRAILRRRLRTSKSEDPARIEVLFRSVEAELRLGTLLKEPKLKYRRRVYGTQFYLDDFRASLIFATRESVGMHWTKPALLSPSCGYSLRASFAWARASFNFSPLVRVSVEAIASAYKSLASKWCIQAVRCWQ